MKSNKLLLIIIMIFIFISCKKSKYSDLKNLINDIITIQNEYIEDLQEANSIDDYKDALVEFAEDMIDLKYDIDKLQIKYPELKESSQLPPEIVSLLENFKNKSIKTEKTSMEIFNPQKSNQFSEDKEFKAIMIKFGEAMQSLNFFYIE